MKIEIWSDIACPWCYIGKRRFEKALGQFEHRDAVEVVWRSYQLDAVAPASYGVPTVELLAKKYGMTAAQAAEANARVSEQAAGEGLAYRLDRTQAGNTFDAHRLTHLAARYGRQEQMNERLMRAYLEEGELMSDPETLVRLAGEVGLPEAEVRDLLAGEELTQAVRADEYRGQQFGVRGVPFFAIDEKYAISGAQPAAVMLQVLREVWAKSQPLVAVGGSGGQCADGSCEV